MFILCGFIFGIPTVASFHTDLVDLLTNNGAYEFQKLLIMSKEFTDSLFLDSCATTSQSFQQKLAKQGVHCEHIIKTSVDIDMFSPTKKNSALRSEMTFGDPAGFLCVYVGRISNEKRLDIIRAAVQKLTGDKATYIAIVGDGPSAARWAKLHGKDNRIYCKPCFLSHAELAEIYASSDLHVSASEFETLGNTVLEALACGIPVVVPHTQGFRDTVRHEQDGFLFAPGDSGSASSFIQRLKDDPRLGQTMGANGRQAMKVRTVSAVVADLLQWYARGQQRGRNRGWLRPLVGTLFFCCMLPLLLTLFEIYDLLVNVLLKPFIQYRERQAGSKSN